MPYVERWGDDRIVIHSEYRERELVKQVPGAKWDDGMKVWWCPLSWAACMQLRGVFGDLLQIGEQLVTWAQGELDGRVSPCLALREAEDAELPAGVVPDTLPKTGDTFRGKLVESDWDLEPRQRAGVRFLATARRAALCDGMGSGKTVQTIMALETLAAEGKDPYPAVVVCPNSMKATWWEEFDIWAPHRKVTVIRGGAAARRKLLAEPADVYVFNWEGLRSHTRLAGYGFIRLSEDEKTDKELNLMSLRSFVADEAHRGKDPKSKQTRAAWAVARKCEFRFALTGTPLANSPEDTWAIMHMLEPLEWPSRTQFVDRYALQSWSNFGFMQVTGIRGENRDEFLRILDPRFLRRPTKIVVPDLLDKLPPQVRHVELVPKQRKAYEQLRKELLAELDSGVLMATNPLTRMTRLVQLAAAYGEVENGVDMRLSEPSAKLDALDEFLDDVGPEEQVVVFAESRQLIELAAKRLEKHKIPFGLITGAQQDFERQRAVQDFQAGSLRVILCTLGAGGEGLTLTAARHVVFLQRSFSLVKNRQAEDRVYRKGQTREVQRTDIVAVNTIEEHVLLVGEDKEARLEEICRDEEVLRKWLAK